MAIADYEELVIGLALRYPSIPEVQVGFLELNPEHFDPRSPRRNVAAAIKAALLEGVTPSIPIILAKMGGTLAKAGEDEYLRLLWQKPDQFNISALEPADWTVYLKIVESAGVFRQLGDTIRAAEGKLNGIEEMSLVEDPRIFANALVGEISEVIRGVVGGSAQHHIAEAMIAAKEYAESVRTGRWEDVVIDIGWPSFRRYSIPRPSSYITISGLSSIGKTQLALQMILGCALSLKARNQPGCAMIFEFEQTKVSMATRMICCLARLDSMQLDGGQFTSEEYARFDFWADRLSRLPIVFATERLNSAQIVSQIKACHLSPQTGPAVMVLVDYPELQSDKGDSEELRVSFIARTYATFCREIEGCILGIYQFPKISTATKLGGYTPERYSAAPWQASDANMEIYNPIQMRAVGIDYRLPSGMKADVAYSLLKKNRDRAPGQIELGWISEWTQFRDRQVAMGYDIYEIEGLWAWEGGSGDF